jgi:hypothetical protein
MDEACETPMSEHVARFWQLLAEGNVRLLVDTYHPGCGGHWNSSSFPDDVAKELAGDRLVMLEALRTAASFLLAHTSAADDIAAKPARAAIAKATCAPTVSARTDG